MIAEDLINLLNPIREEMIRLMSHPEYLMKVITEGSEKAMEVAEQTWIEIKDKVGLGGTDIIHDFKSQKKCTFKQ